MTKASDTRPLARPLIVGIGAAAGGLDAFQELLASIGESPNMAIVFVQHHKSARDSLLADRLKNLTSMSIVKLAGRKKLKPDTLYLCPPHTRLDLRKGFVSIPAQVEGGQTGVIDHFFHELAEDQGKRGVGVILSGLGSDGTLGLKAISDRGGMTFAQSEESAKFASMPRSAATTGVADHIMTPAEIATELLAYAKHLEGLAGETSDSRMKKRIEDSVHPSGTTTLVAGSREPDTATDLTARRQRILLDEFSPQSCVINESGQVLDAAANLEKYLLIVDGVCQNNILKMANSGLRVGLRAAIAEAKRKVRRVTHENMSMRVGKMIQRVMITVQPMPQVGEQEPLFMIVFHDVGLPVNREDSQSLVYGKSHDADAVIAQMELELETTRHDLDKSVQDMESANEELKSSNEELLSLNEELQSANEELETSKEEIRATSDAVARANSDLENLLRSTQIATVFLDDELRIRSFTPAINDIYELLPTDIGRPLERFVPSVVNMPRLPDPKALKGDDAPEPTVLANSGKAYIRRVLPYRSHTGETDGIVVTFADVTELRESEQQFRGTFDNAAVGIAHVGFSGEWLQVNDRLCEITGHTRDALLSKTFQDITHPEDLQADLHQLQRLIAGKIDAYSMEKRYLRPSGDPVWINLTVSATRDADGQPDYVIAVIEDIDEKVRQRSVVQESERNWRLVVDVAQIGVLRIDYLKNTIIADTRAARLYSVPADTPIPRSEVHARIHPDDRQMMEHLIAASMAPDSDGQFAVEHRVLLHDGTLRWLNVRKQIFYEEIDGRRLATHGVWAAIDITEKNEAAGQLLKAKQRSDLAMTTGRLGEWEWDVRSDVVIWRDSLINLLGYSRDNAPRTLQEFVAVIHPDDRASTEELIQSSLRSSREHYLIENRLLRADGKVLWIEGRGLIHRAVDGQPLSIVGMATDITERKIAELKLADREAHLRRVIDGSLGFLVVLGPDGTVLEPNATALASIDTTRDELVGRKFWDCYWWNFDPEVQAQVREMIARAAQGETVRQDLAFRISHDQRRIGDSAFSPVLDEHGTVSHVVGSGVDITDRHEYESELRKARRLAEAANESKSEFVANMSHEIRTPMTAVLGYADLLFAREDDPEKLEHLKTIKRNGNFLLEIINDILDLSMIEAGKMAIERVTFSPSKLVADVHSMMKVRAGEKKVQFDIDYDGPVPEKISSDPRRLKQILVNLIGNAIKFTEVGNVRTTVRFLGSDSQQLQFEVSDSGIGMTEEQRLRLFQPFVQGDTSISRRFGGAGLGLAISQRLVGILGGDISVVSRFGEGSVFTFTIATGAIDNTMLIDPPSNPTDKFPQETSNQGINLDGLILVVDDQKDIRVLVKHFLTGAGANVNVAEDGEAAVKHVKNALAGKRPIPDLILLDMQMPRLDGYGTVEELRKIGYQNPVIALTANAMQSDMNRCLASGCDAYLRKPIEPSVLLQRVEQMMNQEQSQDQHGQSILIVDDSADTVRLLKLLLERDGKIVSSEHTGKGAIESARKFTPHTVILDLTLPDMTGFEVLASLKAMPHLSKTRFLALTGHTDKSDVRRCLEAGFHQHVAKPIDIASLKDLLNTWVAVR